MSLEVARSATSLTLPWPPSVNTYWNSFSVGSGRRVVNALSDRAKQFRNDVAVAITKQLGRARLVPYIAPVRIDVELRAPDRRARDIDNHLKGLFDALTHAGVWKDDVLVDELTLRRGQLLRDGAAIVLITPLDLQPDPTTDQGDSSP